MSDYINEVPHGQIDIWIDVVCPFCFLAKKKLESALKKADCNVKINWHSFQLDPLFPDQTSMPSLEYLKEKKGLSEKEIEEMCTPLILEGKRYGIEFDFNNSSNFNTFKAHRLIHWAKAYDKSEVLTEAFMKACFCDGIDLSVEKNLYDVIKRIGLDVVTAENVLNTDAYIQNVLDDIKLSKKLDIKGVPSFISDKKLMLYGAPEEALFSKMIIEACFAEC
ncbi:MAG: DsbA family oxidoreductase [Saprospiraceae bacterium]|nr:DsbA family oxidoreductase [Saprospiraceae bacterium]